MIEMVATINKTNFSGVQMVTCYTCHHGRDVPVTSIPLDRVYSGPPQEDDDVVPPAVGGPTADADSGQIPPGHGRRAAAE